ncbi:MAG: nitrite/sulfite reductase [Vicinamibacteria bacterium]
MRADAAALGTPDHPDRRRGSFVDPAEVEEYARTLGAFERGEITAEDWRVFRLGRGNYPQRQEDDSQMLRVKIPQGVLDSAQLRALADVAERWSRGFAHVTTRQNVQFHFIALHDVERALHRLAEAGLTTREACGNTVRNVTACPYAGVTAAEAFDVTPYAEALTRHFLRHPLGSGLPRKFKVAFEGCPDDHAFAAINDIGWHARLDAQGRRGFRVVAGGGTATLCVSAPVLVEFLPAADVLRLAEAILRVFKRLGDYEHRKRNRMKYLIRTLGWETWKLEVERELEAVRAEVGPALPFDPDAPPEEQAPGAARSQPPDPGAIAAEVTAFALRGPGLRPSMPSEGDPDTWASWRATNLRPQKQGGFSLAMVTLPLGDITSAQLRVLADLALAYADGTVRTTHDQNLLLRWVRDEDAPDLHDRLRAAGLGRAGAGTIADVTSCPGAESCRLAVTHSRGLGHLLRERLRSRADLASLGTGLDLKISGCPNGCGQHHVAGLGFQGSVRQVGGRPLPQYFVMLGGGIADGVASFGRLAAKLPARRVPEAVERLLTLYAAERTPGESARSFLQRLELAHARELLADLEAISDASARPDDFVDPGEDAGDSAAGGPTIPGAL